MRNNIIQATARHLQTQIEGRRCSGRRKMSRLKNIQEWTGHRDELNLLGAQGNRELLLFS